MCAIKKSPHPTTSWVTDSPHLGTQYCSYKGTLGHPQAWHHLFTNTLKYQFSWLDFISDSMVWNRLLPVDLLMCVLWVRYIIYLNSSIYWTNIYWVPLGFHGGSAGKGSACNAGDLGSIPGLGISPGEGSGNLLQYSGLEYSMDYIVHGVTKSWTWLSDFHLLNLLYNQC